MICTTKSCTIFSTGFSLFLMNWFHEPGTYSGASEVALNQWRPCGGKAFLFCCNGSIPWVCYEVIINVNLKRLKFIVSCMSGCSWSIIQWKSRKDLTECCGGCCSRYLLLCASHSYGEVGLRTKGEVGLRTKDQGWKNGFKDQGWKKSTKDQGWRSLRTKGENHCP